MDGHLEVPAGEADLVFLPYNYLIDPVIRTAMDLEIDGSVIILDEAHNLEDTACDAGSAEVCMPQYLSHKKTPGTEHDANSVPVISPPLCCNLGRSPHGKFRVLQCGS